MSSISKRVIVRQARTTSTSSAENERKAASKTAAFVPQSSSQQQEQHQKHEQQQQQQQQKKKPDLTTVIPSGNNFSKVVHRVRPDGLIFAIGKYNPTLLGPLAEAEKQNPLCQFEPDEILIVDVRDRDRPVWGWIDFEGSNLHLQVSNMIPHNVKILCRVAHLYGKKALVFHCLHSKHRAVFTVTMLARLIETDGAGGGVPDVHSVQASVANRKIKEKFWTLEEMQALFETQGIKKCSKSCEKVAELKKEEKEGEESKTESKEEESQQQQKKTEQQAVKIPWPSVHLLTGGYKAFFDRTSKSDPSLLAGVPEFKLTGVKKPLNTAAASSAPSATSSSSSVGPKATKTARTTATATSAASSQQNKKI